MWGRGGAAPDDFFGELCRHRATSLGEGQTEELARALARELGEGLAAGLAKGLATEPAR